MDEKSRETIYRWEWFRRSAWREGFRGAKRGTSGGSCAAFQQILDGLGGGPALDSSCGLGLKTILLKEMGLNVAGSDGCAFAVEKARELADLERLDIDYFTSSWAELASRTPRCFDGIFNDALSWTVTREEFEASLRGFLGVLKPHGVLVFMGAEAGSSDDPAHRKKLLEELWSRRPGLEIDWTHEEKDTRCTRIIARELGPDFMDEHSLYLVEEAGRQRLETATVRQPVYWHWPILREMFADAGFSNLQTREFPGLGQHGASIKLNVATK
jgi:SAM-dependent methyltransferase